MENLRNYSEIMVDNVLDDIIRSYDACDCDKCRMDMKAIALNSLPNMYFVTEYGEVFEKLKALDKQLKTDVTAMVTMAVLKVKEKPRHA